MSETNTPATSTMNSEKKAITVLLATAVLLLLAIVFVPRPATGNSVTLKERDYVICTQSMAGVDDAIYIADTRLGVIGVFVFDNASRSLQLRSVRPLNEAFGGH